MNNITIQSYEKSIDWLSCPKCQGSLLLDDDKIICESCAFEGFLSEGIYDLRYGRHDYYFNPVPRSKMKKLVKQVENTEWPKIIRSFMSSVNDNQDWLDNLVVDGRYAWKLFLGLPKNAALLDLGCGLGNMVHNLAPQMGKVYALDLTWERLEFSRLRCSLFNPDDNIKYIAGGDGKYLPFPDNSLDCVTLSGVLEWIPDNGTQWETKNGKISKALKMVTVFFGSTNPKKIQIQFLKEIRRVLKPNGQLFIGIENRFNYEYFMGRPDHHTALKYGSLLPRFLANLYSILMRRNPYRTYTYSLGGYRRLLKKAGFLQQEFLGLLDGYSKLNEITNIDIKEGMWGSRFQNGIRSSLKRNKMLVPAFGIIASEEKSQYMPLVSELITDLASKLLSTEDEDGFKINQFLITGKDKAIIYISSGNLNLVIKIPFTAYMESTEANGTQTLKQLSKYSGFKDIVPTPVSCGKICNLPYFVETRVLGDCLSEKICTDNRESYSNQVFMLWKEMLDTGFGAKHVTIDEELFSNIVSSDINEIRTVTSHPEKLDLMFQYVKQVLTGCKIKIGLKHGDFSTHNILVDSFQKLKLIDWESSQQEGLVILDMINYLDSAQRTLAENHRVVDTAKLLLVNKWPCVAEITRLSEAMNICGLDYEKHLEVMVLLYWMQHTGERLRSGMKYNNIQIEKLINEFLVYVGERISVKSKISPVNT